MPSWPNRLASLVFAFGICLHVYNIAFGGAAVVRDLMTPIPDRLFGLLILVTLIAVWRVRHRLVLPGRAARLGFAATVLLLAVSVPIHLSSIVTGSTAYLEAFPWWYSYAEIPLVFAPLIYFNWRVRLRRQPSAATVSA